MIGQFRSGVHRPGFRPAWLLWLRLQTPGMPALGPWIASSGAAPQVFVAASSTLSACVWSLSLAPFTDAAWTPLFVVAGAVVVDLGAINSHAMVVARELGIPCVVSVQDATSRIPDGALVTVDGTAGAVTVMAPSAGDKVAAL